MPAVITNKTRLFNVKNFIEAFSEKSPDHGYVFIGKSDAWVDELTPPVPDYSPSGEREFFENLIAMKKVQSSNIVQIVKRFDWTSGQIYDPYDDTEQDIINRTNPLYVLTDDSNVYKCLYRPDATESVNKPTGTSLTPITTADGYIWKFMYNLSVADCTDLLTANWMPVERPLIDDGSNQWLVQEAAIDGTISNLVIEDGGAGYTGNVVITSPGSGDGTFSANGTVVGGTIVSIDITNAGADYTNDPILVIDEVAPTPATLRAVIAPVGGHGFDAIVELNAIYAMVKVQFVESEGGEVPTATTFRQVGILLNPLTTDNTGVLLDVTGVSSDFVVGEEVTGGVSGATGTVVKWDYQQQKLWLSQTIPSAFSIEAITSPSASATITAININANIPATENVYNEADIEDNQGELVYLENRIAIQRNDSQTEDIRLIVEF